ncbi:universal stress protein [Corynebacterium timonense]|uniref:Nucleotide-binding universal stress protein, UspA family n=1 Tax=Corynebacterium timonense TaxID=441500 RepID=A0A1H1USQ3_9CORY|nr:universal stress protein [Corynebacterium timonense]SDS75507.1 Nucleotide-binding universal stress protein, UspA family [Corynebacterium timonense]
MTLDLPQRGSETPSVLRLTVGWDTTSLAGLEFAAWLGRFSASPRSWTKSLAPKKYKKWLAAEKESVTSKALAALADHLPRNQWASEPCTLVDATSEPAALTSAAQSAGADIIVLSSSATLKQARFLASPTADALMHSSPVSLGLVPTGLKLSKKGVTRVNLALLHSGREDTTGLRCAVRLALLLEVPLRLVSVLPEMPDVDSLGSEPAESYEAALSLLDRARDEAFKLVAEETADETTAEPEPPLEVETTLAYGNGWEKAVSSVKWKKGDLICLGSHPSAAQQRVLAGSRASEFLRYAPAPVVIFPRVEG